MGSKGVLELKRNPREVRATLARIIGKRASDKIEASLQRQARGLIKLGAQHLRFAKSCPPQNWRQTVSRAYYGGYNISRGLRLFIGGDYSQDSKDHQSFGKIPSDFPNQATYSNKLAMLREDRNLCDYDHTASSQDLSISPADALTLIDDFAKDVTRYLVAKGYRP